MRRAIRFPEVVEAHRMRIFETFTVHFKRAASAVARRATSSSATPLSKAIRSTARRH